MTFTWDSIQANAIAFSKRWKDAHNEETEAQSFLIDFLHVFDVNGPVAVGDFEYKVPLSGNRTGGIDYLWKEFDRVKTDPAALDRFHEKTARFAAVREMREKSPDPGCTRKPSRKQPCRFI